MKIIKILSAVFFLIQNSLVFAQFRIDPSGHVGMGTNYPNPGYKCHIKGDLLLTTYPEIPPPYSSFVELKLKVTNGAQVGSNTGSIDFWSAEYGHNIVHAAQFHVVSDSTLKTNIAPLKNGLDIIMKLKSYSYQMKSGNSNDLSRKKTNYGFLAQEIETVLPNITSSSQGLKLIDYIQVIPLLVNAVQYQQKTIDDMKSEVESLTSELNKCCEKNSSANAIPSGGENSSHILYQNKPNPFTEQTIIAYDIKSEIASASIMIFDMQGALYKTYPINKSGKGEVTIEANGLKAGMYLYSLIVNKNEVDTKRMILNN